MTSPLLVEEIQTLPPVETSVRVDDDLEGAADQSNLVGGNPIAQDLTGVIPRWLGSPLC